MGVQKTFRYLETLLFLTAYEGAWPRQDRPENAQDSFMVADLPRWSGLTTWHYQGYRG